MPENEFHFKLSFWDDEKLEGFLDLDDFQLVFDPYNKQVRINLTGAQVDQLQQYPSAMSRLAK